MAIQLNSSLSYERLELSTIAIGKSECEFELAIYTHHWDDEHENGVRLTSESVLVATESLLNVASRIATVFENNSAPESTIVGEFPLAAKSSFAQLTLVFGPRPDVLDGNKPVVTIHYKLGRCVGQVFFVTDQSCLRQFSKQIRLELSRWLDNIALDRSGSAL